MTYTATINKLQTAAANHDREAARDIVAKAIDSNYEYHLYRMYRRARIGRSRAALNMQLHYTRRLQEARIDRILRNF